MNMKKVLCCLMLFVLAILPYLAGAQVANFTLRLVDNNKPNATNLTEGRVEVFYSGAWGTICDDIWDLNDANVVCRQLGFAIALSRSGNAKYGRGTGPIWLDNVACRGNETSIDQCNHPGWGVSNCLHSEDAGVECSYTIPNVTLRLAGGSNESRPTKGRVEVWYNGEWGTICDDYWDLNDARVVCRQLGFASALRAIKSGEFGGGTGPIYLDNMHCTGTEEGVQFCLHNGWNENNCNHREDAGVECTKTSPMSTVRLVGGKNASEGRVEVQYDGEWGTVCDDGWTTNSSKVVCRQAGYQYALRSTSANEFGQGNGSIFFDNVQCTGDETDIFNCNHLGFKVHNCDHDEDIGVVCGNYSQAYKDLALRLVAGPNNATGRVELYYKGEWGTVCNDHFDIIEARVLCRLLGFRDVLRILDYTESGRGFGPVWLDDLNCTGNEINITQCLTTDIGNHDCSHLEDVGLECTDEKLDQNVSIRLVGGDSEMEGRVEVLYGGRWGTVCDDHWDYKDATVVCRQLGFPLAVTTTSSEIFGPGSGPIWMDNVECVGIEENLGSCNQDPIGQNNCKHGEDAGVICSSESGVVKSQVRLVRGASLREGRVEVFIRNQWGTICDDEFTNKSAGVICRQLGHSGYGAVVLRPGTIPGGTDPIWLDGTNCLGNETDILQCPHLGLGRHNCVHNEDVAIRCKDGTPKKVTTTPAIPSPSPTSVSIQTTSVTIKPTPKAEIFAEGTVRLANGNNKEGRVEIYHDGEWGTVCDDIWDLKDATVVCRQLGFPVAIRRSLRAEYGPGSGRIWMDNVACSGHERNLSACRHNGWDNSNCDHDEDAGVVCGDEIITVDVRVVGGRNTSDFLEGRVEVLYNNTWGTVCDDFWDMREATVVCQQLGYRLAIRKSTRSEFGAGRGIIWLDNVECRGDEENIGQCFHSGWGENNCDHSEDAGVVCAMVLPPINVRLVGGKSNVTEGRVEVSFNETWGTVCDDGWTLKNAKVICRMLGHKYAISAPTNAHFGQGSDPIWLDDVQCNGTETTIADCLHGGWGEGNCHHSEDAGVICSAELPEISVRLVGGTSSMGRLEVQYNGEWGTVCDDGWDINDATVACRMLGFNYSLRSTSPVEFGRGNGSIFLFNLGCQGDETNLLLCDHGGIGTTFCSHSEDVGVICSNTLPKYNEGDLRLIAGVDNASGRVEIYHEGSWGTICNDEWDIKDARVACRQLGFKEAYAIGGADLFGRGFDQIWLDNLNCTGEEENLSNCSSLGWGIHNCNHVEDAGVFCTNSISVNRTISIRLVNGTSSREGRLEVFYSGRWGTVCNDHWSHKNSEVVCRHLGFPFTLGTASVRYFGMGTGIIWLDDVMCRGNETRLDQCDYDDYGNHNCGHIEDIGVICADKKEVPPIRLVGSNNSNEGRIEVLFRAEWGTVCDDYWTMNSTEVVCRQLGFPGAIKMQKFGPGTGPILFDDVRCGGDETALLHCPHNGFGVHNCFHGEDVGVVCQPLPTPSIPIPTSSFSSVEEPMTTVTSILNTPFPSITPTPVPPQNLSLRLVGGSNSSEGRLEILFNGEWGTVCDDGWGGKEAAVACRQLGYAVAIRPATSSVFGRGWGPILLDNVDCTGEEDSIYECSHNGWGDHNCDHSEDAGVVCSDVVPNVSVRLRGGTLETQGRVEVYYDGQWGTICDDFWGLNDASVICRQLGYGFALSAPGSAEYGQGRGQIWLDNVECKGTESDIARCYHGGWGEHDCRHTEDAGVWCSDTLPDVKFRLVGGKSPSEGRVEMFYNNEWGTICDDDWISNNTQVICRSLGYAYGIRSTSSKEFGPGNGTIWLDNLGCTGDEAHILNCTHAGLGEHNCGHYEDVGIVCGNSPDSGTEGQLRLIGGSSNSNGRLEIYRNGRWGTICDNNWDKNATQVVCRQLNFTTGLSEGNDFGYSLDGVLLDTPICTGEEKRLLDCNTSDWSSRSCGISRIVGVYCSNITPDKKNVQLRLVGGSSPNYGRVEVRYGDLWGTICNDDLHFKDAKVICRQLGYPVTVGVLARGIIEPGTGLIWLDNLRCSGDEKNIIHCKHPGWGRHDCSHSEDVGVMCASNYTDLDIRLVDGPNEYEGRVEMKFLGEWGTICNDNWDLPDAEVVCKQLGHRGALRAYTVSPSRRGIPQGTGKIWLDDLRCVGNEESIVQCQHSGLGGHNCAHSEDAVVECRAPGDSSIPVFSGGELPSQFFVRLAGGNRSYGRVEVLYNTRNVFEWGTICDDDWDLNDAKVVCRQLNFTTALQAVSAARFGSGEGPIWLDNVDCMGNEKNLVNCSLGIVGSHDCTHAEDAGVVCINYEPDLKVRLADGRKPSEGRLEVSFNGEWGTVCKDGWDINDAAVVCRQLGFPSVMSVAMPGDFPNGTGNIWMDEVDCLGAERSLFECSYKGWGVKGCTHEKDVGIYCSPKSTSVITSSSTTMSTSSATSTTKSSATPTTKSSATPTMKSSATSTMKSSATSTMKSSATPTMKSSATPTVKSSATPTVKSSATPTVKSSATPTVKSSATPTVKSSATPTVKSSATPTVKSSTTPTFSPTPGPSSTSGSQGTNVTVPIVIALLAIIVIIALIVIVILLFLWTRKLQNKLKLVAVDMTATELSSGATGKYEKFENEVGEEGENASESSV